MYIHNREALCMHVCVCVYNTKQHHHTREWWCGLVLSHIYDSFCDVMNYSLPGSSVHEISQARILEWVTISFCSRSSRPRDRTHVFCIGCGLLYH